MKLIARIPAALAGGALATLVTLTVLSVVARYVFGSPLHWLEEVSGLLMIWIVMAGAIVCERDSHHLAISMLTDLIPKRIRAAVETVITVLSIATLLYVAWLGWQLSIGARKKLTDILEISWFWIDLAVPVGAVGAAIYMLRSLKSSVLILFGNEPKPETSSEEGHNQ